MRKRNYIFASSFFFSLGVNTLGLSLIFRLKDQLSFSPGQIGTYIALGQIFFFIGCNLYHRLGFSLDPVRVFTFASAAVFLSSVFLAYAKSSIIIYASFWALQIGTGLFWPSVQAWLTEGLNSKELNREMGIFNRCWMSASMAGPLIAGILYSINSVLNFLVINISYLSVFVLICLMRHRYPAFPAQPPAAGYSETEIANSNTNMIKNPKLDLYRYRGWIGAFCSSMFVGVLVNIAPLHIRDSLGFSERTAGMILFMRCVTALVGFALLAKFNAWHFNRRWFVIAQIGLLLSTLLFLLAGKNISVFYAGALFYGFLNAACYNNSMFYSGSTGKNQKKNFALHEIFLCLGVAAGTAGGGFFYQHFSFAGVCLALLVSLCIGLASLIWLNRKENPGVLF